VRETLIKKLRYYAKQYRNGETLGRAIEGTEDIMNEAADAIWALLKEIEWKDKRVELARQKAGIYQAALDTWGAESQTVVVFEEMSELQKALCKNYRGADNRDNIAEEIADVQIMLEQMILLHNCGPQVQKWRKMKLDRLADRLREAGADGLRQP